MEFLVKIQAPDTLRQRDIIEDLRDGLHYRIGGGDTDCEYLQELKKVRIMKYSQKAKVMRVTP